MKLNLVPKITHPCPRQWNEMEGDGMRRYCEHCQLHVHNFSAMTPQEQQQLLTTSGGRTCIAYLNVPNTVSVRPGTWLFVQRLLSPWRRVLALFTALLPASMTGCSSPVDSMLPGTSIGSAYNKLRRSKSFSNSQTMTLGAMSPPAKHSHGPSSTKQTDAPPPDRKSS